MDPTLEARHRDRDPAFRTEPIFHAFVAFEKYVGWFYRRG